MTATQNYPYTIFSPALVRGVGSIKMVLGEFLDKQLQNIQQELEKHHHGVPVNAVEKLIDKFVTLEGTKRPQDPDQVHVPQLSREQILFCLERLEKCRILRFDDGQYELAHDTLALNIAERRSSEMVQTLKVKKIFEQYDLSDKSANNILTKREVLQVEGVKDLLIKDEVLKDREWQFVEKSTLAYRMRSRRVVIISVGISLILAGLTIWALISRNQAAANKIKAVENEKVALSAKDSLEKKVEQLQEARDTISQKTKDQLSKDYDQYLRTAMRYIDREDYESVAEQYELAIDHLVAHPELEIDTMEISKKKQQLKRLKRKKEEFENYIQEGKDAFRSSDEYGKLEALKSYKKALELNYKTPRKDMVETLLKQATYSLPLAREKFCTRYKRLIAADPGDPRIKKYRKQIREMEQEMEQEMKKNGEQIESCLGS